MPINPERRGGWSIHKAIRRTVGHDALTANATAVALWRRARSARAEYGNWHRFLASLQSSEYEIRDRFRSHLLAGRLVAWGRKASVMEEPTRIPPSAWDATFISDYLRSRAREQRRAYITIFDVRIYPVIEDPDAVEQLADRPLAEVLRKYLLADPQAADLRKRAIIAGGDPIDFPIGFGAPSVPWPVVNAGNEFWQVKLNELKMPSRLRASRLTAMANAVLQRRFAGLINYLAAGELVADGTDYRGRVVAVPPSVWNEAGIHLDPHKGDLLVHPADPSEPGRTYSPIFIGLHLRRPKAVRAVFHVNSTKYDALLQGTSEQHSPATHLRPRKAIERISGKACSRRPPHWESTEAAIAALWPEGIPPRLMVKERDEMIIKWQRKNGSTVVSAKTISRVAKARSAER